VQICVFLADFAASSGSCPMLASIASSDCCEDDGAFRCPRFVLFAIDCGALFGKFTSQVEWSRLEETLGSNHHIVQTQVQHHKAPTRLWQANVMNWPAFRK
ncbi:hypothetical protein HPB47_028393, partial [Ixodes persulcatus]